MQPVAGWVSRGSRRYRGRHVHSPDRTGHPGGRRRLPRNSELYLKYAFDGQELDLTYAERTLRHVYTLWGRPVHLETVLEGRGMVLSFDGLKNHKTAL